MCRYYFPSHILGYILGNICIVRILVCDNFETFGLTGIGKFMVANVARGSLQATEAIAYAIFMVMGLPADNNTMSKRNV